MFNKFFKFVKGYVIISLYGHDTERFINICVHHGIKIEYAEKKDDGSIEACVMRNEFKLLRHAAFKTHTKIKIMKKRGLYNLSSRYGRRYAFFFGAAVFTAFFVISSQYIWTIEINGIENASYDTVIESLKESGVYPGARKNKVIHGTDIKNKILHDNADIAWAWVYIEGAKARVEVYEKIIPPTVVDRYEPCDIIASCDGYIKNIVVKNGHQLVENGDTVCAGDTLVSGRVPVFREGDEERYAEVHSMCTAEAYTVHRAEGIYNTYYETRLSTGKHRVHYTAEIFGKCFKLSMKNNIPYKDYDRDEKRHELHLPFLGYTGIAWTVDVYNEVIVKREQLSMDTALEFAKNALEEKISKELLYDSTLTDKEISYSCISDDKINVTLTMNFIEKIGTENPLDKAEE